MLTKPLLTLLAIGMMSCSISHADLVVFTDQASWLSAVSGTPTLEDFEGATVDVEFGLASNATTSPNGDLGLSANANFNDNAAIDVSPTAFTGAAINGNVVLSMAFLDNGSGTNSQETMTVTLPAGISAVGFEFSNYDFQGDGTFLTLGGTSGGVVGAFDSTTDGFFGLVDTGLGAMITSVSFTGDPSIGTGVSAFNSIDDIRYGIAAIPEPTATLALGLVASGLGMSLGRRRCSTICVEG